MKKTKITTGFDEMKIIHTLEKLEKVSYIPDLIAWGRINIGRMEI